MGRANAQPLGGAAAGPGSADQASRGGLLLALVSVTAAVLAITALLGMARSGPLFTEASLLYFAVIFYGAASALYIGFGVLGAERLARFAVLAVWAGFLANTLAAAHRWWEAGRPPFSNIYEMLLSFVWTLAALTLFIERRWGVRIIGSVTMPLAVVGVLLMQVMPSAVRPLVPALQSTWLHIHVSLAMLAYAACAVSFALALMFLIRDGVKTPAFLFSTSALLTGVYLAMASRFDSSGGLLVAAWNAEGGHEIFLAERAPLWVVIPGMGWVLFAVLAAVLAPLVLTVWGWWNGDQRGHVWARRAFFVALALQAAATTAFVVAARDGVYPALEVSGSFATSLSASPFLLAGMVSGLFASLLLVMLLWRRGSLEQMLPAPETLDRLTYKTIGIGFPMLTLMIASGAWWANQTWGSYWSWDPKETWALITWLVYAGYLHMRIARGWRGRRAAYFAILGFAVVLFTFFGVTYLLPGLHAYA